MNKIYRLASCVALAACGLSAAFAQDDSVSVEYVIPAEGVTEEAGSISVAYTLVPSINKECNETAKFYVDGKLYGELLPTSTRVQMGVEQQPDNEVLFAFVTRPIKDPGSYKLTVPEGFFTFSNGTLLSPASEFNWSIVEAAEAIIDPAPGYMKSVPNSMTVTFPGATKITRNELVKNEDTGRGVILWDTPDATIDPEVMIMGSRVRLVYPSNSSYTTPGTYALDLPYGAFDIEYGEGNVQKSPSLFYRFYISTVGDIKIWPAPGTVYGLNNIEIGYVPEDDIVFGRWHQGMYPSIYQELPNGERGERVSVLINTQEVKRGDLVAHFAPSAPVTKPGKYMVCWNKSSFCAYGYLDPTLPDEKSDVYLNAPLEWHYTIEVSPVTLESAIGTPIEVNNASEFVFNFPNLEEGTAPVLSETAVGSFRDSWDDEIAKVTFSLRQDADNAWQLVALVAPAVTAADTYSLVVPEGTVSAYGSAVDGMVENQTQSFVVKVDPSFSGITDAVEEAANVDVYRVDGTLAGRALTPAQIAKLPAGLYIAGGRKIIVK